MYAIKTLNKFPIITDAAAPYNLNLGINIKSKTINKIEEEIA